MTALIILREAIRLGLFFFVVLHLAGLLPCLLIEIVLALGNPRWNPRHHRLFSTPKHTSHRAYFRKLEMTLLKRLGWASVAFGLLGYST